VIEVLLTAVLGFIFPTAEATVSENQPVIAHTENQGIYDHPEFYEPPEPIYEHRGVCEGEFCSCIVFLQNKGILIKGDAIDQVPNLHLTEAVEGDILLFDYEGIGHAALILQKYNGVWFVEEANYKEGEYTQRTIEFGDKSVVGAMRLAIVSE
jgi:hypothetical protein